MANWNSVHEQIVGEQLKRQRTSPHDDVRRKYLKELADLTGRNVVAYYSGWLQRSGPDVVALVTINDDDKNGFMACFNKLDFSKGLDLILHSPGGDVAATESIIDYIRSKFDDNVRVIVPQISMSGGTMIACAARQIVMGHHSNLGPVDPQFGSWPAIAIVKEFERARIEVLQDQRLALIWQPIIAHYGPTLLSKAHHAIQWSREIVSRALKEGMFRADPDRKNKTDRVVEFLLSDDVHKAHGRHIHRKELRDIGLNILDLEHDQKFQDAVLCVHHAFMNTLMNTNAIKLIENHDGIAFIKALQFVSAPQQQAPFAAQPHRPKKRSMSLGSRLREALKILLGH